MRIHLNPLFVDDLARKPFRERFTFIRSLGMGWRFSFVAFTVSTAAAWLRRGGS